MTIGSGIAIAGIAIACAVCAATGHFDFVEEYKELIGFIVIVILLFG